MECQRCQGLMVEDHFFDAQGTQGFMWMKGWRCMNCGHVMDSVREANRRLQETTLAVGPWGVGAASSHEGITPGRTKRRMRCDGDHSHY